MPAACPRRVRWSRSAIDAVWLDAAALAHEPRPLPPHPLAARSESRRICGSHDLFDLLARNTRSIPSSSAQGRGERPRWRISVLEPNINVLKTFHLPLMVAEETFRLAPRSDRRVLLFNTRHLAGVAHFDDLTTSPGPVPRGQAVHRGPPRDARRACAPHADAVIVHQWENDLNYLYWDVLWSGHPLIHNSPSAQRGRLLLPVLRSRRRRTGDRRCARAP